MKKFFVFLFSFMIVVCSSGCAGTMPRQSTATDVAMGTVVNMKLYCVDEKNHTERIMELLRELEEQELSVRSDHSEVTKVNAHAGEGGVSVSPQLGEILERCLEIGEKSQGALDVTLGNVVKLWNIDTFAGGDSTGFLIPGEETLERALLFCGNDKLHYAKEQKQVSLEEGCALDLGAIGKGFALDRIHAYLQEQEGITGAVISVGGSVLTYGRKPDGTEWKVGIADPSDTSKVLGYLTISGTLCVSTSGDYERYVEQNGVRYHHILDPHTGYPAESGFSAVTILSEDGFLSDALSTACFVLGSEKGLLLAQEYGCEALFVTRDGKLEMTEGFRQLFDVK